MKHGCMVMTLRLRSSRRSGSRQIHRVRKKRVMFVAMSSSCWSFFSTSKVLFTRNSYHQVKPSSFTESLWSGCRRASSQTSSQLEEKQLGSAPWQSARSHITRFLQFLTSKTLQWFPPPLFAWPRSLRIFPIPQDEIKAERASFGTTEEIHAETQEVIDKLTFETFQGCMQGRIKLFGAPRKWKHFRPLFQAMFLSEGGVINTQTESNTTPPSPKTEITNILFYILNFAPTIKFKM